MNDEIIIYNSPIDREIKTYVAQHKYHVVGLAVVLACSIVLYAYLKEYIKHKREYKRRRW